MSKIAFVLVVIVFGIVMFVAGLLAPAALKAPYDVTLPQWLPTSLSKLIPIKSVAAAGAAVAAATPAAAGGAKAASAPAAIALTSLLVPATPAANTVYALQVALLATADQAADSAAPFTAAQVPVKILNVTTEDGKAWVLVAAGNYNSYDDARTQQTVLAQQFHLLDLPPVIVLPPPKPAA